MVKYVWLEWGARGWVVNVETWQEGIAPYNTLIPVETADAGKNMISAFVRLGYQAGIN